LYVVGFSALPILMKKAYHFLYCTFLKTLFSSIKDFEQVQAAYPACCKPYLHMQAVSNKEFGYSSGHIHS
jgi:hypothetical protein